MAFRDWELNPFLKNWRETNPHWKYKKEKEKRDRWSGFVF